LSDNATIAFSSSKKASTWVRIPAVRTTPFSTILLAVDKEKWKTSKICAKCENLGKFIKIVRERLRLIFRFQSL
jgi:hypothetical protein